MPIVLTETAAATPRAPRLILSTVRADSAARPARLIESILGAFAPQTFDRPGKIQGTTP